MKLELNNRDCKLLLEHLIGLYPTNNLKLDKIINESLIPQYNKLFTRYRNERQEFFSGEEVMFRKGKFAYETEGGTFSIPHKVENKEWIKGVIAKVFRLQNGQYKYIISYGRNLETSPLTNKNIRKSQ